MSGIYIPGMEMPTSCFGCALLDYAGAYKCRIGFRSLTKEHGINISRPPLCPLIHAPDHGRLVDADAIYKRLQKQAMSAWGDGNIRYQIILDVMDAIRFAPTIIPGEERS